LGAGDLKISPKLKLGFGAAAFFGGAAFATTLGAGGAAFATTLGAGGAAFATILGTGAAFFGAAGLTLGGFRNESKTPAFGVGGATFGGVGILGLSCSNLSSHFRALARTISAASSVIFLWSATRLASASAAAVDF
jgi:hypothetical protein